MKHAITTLQGDVTAIFAHRFVIKTASGQALADLGPKGAEQVTLKEGDRVTLVGEQKPSELKVQSIAKEGGGAIAIKHPDKPRHDDHAPSDPAAARRTVEGNGFTIIGEPRRKPKHFEILGRNAAGDLQEHHVDLDGNLRKTVPVGEADPKWAAQFGQS